MSTTKIHITFDSEKLSAIEQFISENIQSVETQLCEQLEKIYIRLVPQPVSQYIDRKQKTKKKACDELFAPCCDYYAKGRTSTRKRV